MTNNEVTHSCDGMAGRGADESLIKLGYYANEERWMLLIPGYQVPTFSWVTYCPWCGVDLERMHLMSTRRAVNCAIQIAHSDKLAKLNREHYKQNESDSVSLAYVEDDQIGGFPPLNEQSFDVTGHVQAFFDDTEIIADVSDADKEHLRSRLADTVWADLMLDLTMRKEAKEIMAAPPVGIQPLPHEAIDADVLDSIERELIAVHVADMQRAAMYKGGSTEGG